MDYNKHKFRDLNRKRKKAMKEFKKESSEFHIKPVVKIAVALMIIDKLKKKRKKRLK